MFPKIFITLITFILLVHTMNSKCVPLFPRMFYNPDSLKVNPQKIDLIFMFNTEASCPLSYIQISYGKVVSKFACSSNKIETYYSDNSTQFFQYVHKCRSNIVEDYQIKQFSYKPYGCSTLTECIPYSSQPLLVQYPTSNQPLRFVVLSDWSALTSAQSYKPINKTLEYTLDMRRLQRLSGTGSQWRISGLIMEGDYAYNMETNHCQNYLSFMNQLTRISKYWPIIPNAGNHETTHLKSMYLFQNSFVIGRISTADGVFKRTQSYRFPNRFTLVNYDAVEENFGKHLVDRYTQMMDAIIEELVKARNNYPDEFVLLGSHYPVKCSQQTDNHCVDTLNKLPELFNFLSTPYMGKGLVDLYIGSHMHQYQRIWPYVNNKYVNQSSPFNRGRLVSIVEGSAGNTQNLVQQINPQYFSAAHTVGVTGFGILSFEGSSNNPGKPFFINYKHVTINNLFEIADEFVITNNYKSQGNLLNE